MKLLDLYLAGKVDGSKVGKAELWPVMGMVEQVGRGRTVEMRLTVEEVSEPTSHDSLGVIGERDRE